MGLRSDGPILMFKSSDARGNMAEQAARESEYTQRELARSVGKYCYYSFISQLEETGRGRVPPDRYRVWASALQVDPKLFVKQLLSYYDPITYGILFGDQDAHSTDAEHPFHGIVSSHSTAS